MTDPLAAYAALLFDFDGTLADSYAAIASSVNHVRAQRGHPALGVDEVKRFVGYGADYLLTHTVPDCRLADDLAAYKAHHPSVMLPLTRLLPGVAALLERLKTMGIKIGLCSNKPRAFSERLLQHLGVAVCFDVVLGPEDVPRPKPAPDMLLAAIERLALPRDRVLYLGDMTVDIATGRSAGVAVWAVATGSQDRATLEAAGSDRVLADMRELVAELGRL